MKLAYSVEVLETDGLPWGIHLGWGGRAQHEHGINRMASDMNLTRHASGVQIACNREVADWITLVEWPDGEVVLAWERPSYEPKPEAYKAKRLRRIVEELWANAAPDETTAAAGPMRAAWDDGGFIVHATASASARALKLLGQSFAAEDLAAGYCLPNHLDPTCKSIGRPGRGLLLVAPGLCPASATEAIVAAQSGLKITPRKSVIDL